jgi:hypothetical protein
MPIPHRPYNPTPNQPEHLGSQEPWNGEVAKHLGGGGRERRRVGQECVACDWNTDQLWEG